ncbi:MAG: hypothetical protein COV66_09470 [Nitrospinae bacterium CG11_big_fil_rev_8_21_14_0_20_45_15]|nr:MAG: hypothetical protein COV66_09470 [Nitrospinae bacterium CG11_big_fil_rev_8_21_14_0_20_45_15]
MTLSPSSTVEPAIEVKNICKSFGFRRAVSNLSFEVQRGEFLTIFGANGAGKTTLLNILSGRTRPSSGTAKVAGFDVTEANPKMRKEIGVISHATCLYPDLSPLENLEFYAKMYGLDRPEECAEKAVEGAGLKKRRHDPVRTFSRGMLQRLTIARATLHQPSILFLDEPFTGLDPLASGALKDYLRSLHTDQRTLLMTTHDISCGLEMGDHIAVQIDGRFALMEPNNGLDPVAFESRYMNLITGGKEG